MRVLVTGGAGFIGSAVIRNLLRSGAVDVLNLDKLTYAANLDSLSEVLPNNRYSLEVADIADVVAVGKAFATFQPDAALHLAAETHVDRSIDRPAPFIDTNIKGTYVLLEAARRYWQGLPASRKPEFRFHHVSTDEVYGSLEPLGHFTEATAYAPNSPYSASKASADFLVRAWHQTFGLPTLISNCSNNYGPYQFPEKLIPVVILSALEGRRIPVYGRGENVRDWLFVEDHAAALWTILQHGKPGETYAVGARNEIANIELVRMICRLMDEVLPESPHRPHESLVEFVTDRPGHDLRYAIDPSKIERELGWRPSVTFEEGLRHTVRWYLSNRLWWEAIRARGFKGERLGLAAKP